MNKFSDYFEAQKKSKIKAGDGLAFGKYKFFNSSNMQTKFYNQALYHSEALIFGTGGNASIHYCNEPFSTSTDCIVFFAKRNDFSVKLVYQYLSGNIHILQNGFKGAGIRHISKGYIEDIELNLPILEQQHQIASIFDKVTCTIELCNQIIEKLDLLVKARFVEIFGDTEFNSNNYPVHKLGNLCVVSSSKRIYQDEQSSFGVPFLRISNLVELIENNQFRSDLFIHEERYNELLENDLVPKAGDILVTSRGTLGKCYIVQNEDKFYFQDGMISWIYNLDKSITPLYLTLLFNTKDIKKQIDNLQLGSTVAYLSITMLKRLNIVVPPIALQEKFANFSEQTEKSKSAVKQVLEKAETLKKALMQKYFG